MTAGWALAAALVLCVGLVAGKDNLRVAYGWREMDFKYDSPEQRWSAIEKGAFKPANVLPFGLEIHRNRMFVTLPRWREGVPASLAYFDLNDNSTTMPVLTPFPSWVAHSLTEADPELVSPFRVRGDRCGRLWVLDSRISGVLEKTKLYGPAQLSVYDLHNDNLLRRHVLPEGQTKQSSFFANLAVDDGDCENTFAYLADLGAPGLVVYSWKERESWRVQHHFFHPDPMSGNFSIQGIEFQWDDGLYGLALSKPQANGFATLYFHPLSSTMEFSVSTSVLRNKTLATSSDIYREFKVLGSRGLNAQAGAQCLDAETGVLFYALPNQNSVGCWQTSNSYKSQDRVYTSSNDLVFPSDVKVDDERRLWVLSNQLQVFIYDELYPGSINFRILTASVKDAIAGTSCNVVASKLPEIISRIDDILKPLPGRKASKSSAGATTYSLGVMLLSCCLLLRSRLL
ncbi:protein yellow [Drosophila sulfurigaster albostrigata]|uniref:protein yellow n=1 Tax=Drosophila sulfurigaster albostrigata TaxID=89887 RepID=UPI002D21D416|nr:protein yellow [Drosophila sulfurigaster albostrigata]XP_062121021.1 protein yellow [Drosophila sulfurigaster albostrigata]